MCKNSYARAPAHLACRTPSRSMPAIVSPHFCQQRAHPIPSLFPPKTDYFSSILGAMQALPTLIFPAMFFIAARKAQNSPVKKYEIGMMVVFCFVLGLLLMVFGMWDAIDGIIKSYSDLGTPFSC